jgi:hypothetical protein
MNDRYQRPERAPSEALRRAVADACAAVIAAQIAERDLARGEAPRAEDAPRAGRLRYMRTRQAAEYANLSESYFQKLRVSGGGPEYFSAGRICLYLAEDIDKWLSTRRRSSSSE